MKEEYSYGIFIDNEKVPSIIGRRKWALDELVESQVFKGWNPVVKQLPKTIVYSVEESRVVLKEDVFVFSEDRKVDG